MLQFVRNCIKKNVICIAIDKKNYDLKMKPTAWLSAESC